MDKIEKRLKKINKRKPVELTAEEEAAILAAEKENIWVSYNPEELKTVRVRLRLPRSLRKELEIRAAKEGMDFNQYVIYILEKVTEDT